ncbi:glucokinase regulatory protein isoform X2 [Takifugu flavidus]|uniref:glucokinase regulatory protein isoform X2 n=1 Tax=Takifugu flavidus TaxID=433684 RepID=UPI00254412E0|nr:glucokinase regulatory protein isoform X2 [Takifugu flavidus]
MGPSNSVLCVPPADCRRQDPRVTFASDQLSLAREHRLVRDGGTRQDLGEKSNPLTRDIDQASAIGIVRMLQACDGQMFEEDTAVKYQRLLSKQVVQTLVEVAKRVELILKDPQDGLVVLSGCGTSGRIAFLVASRFSRRLKDVNQSSVYSYIIAGGDRALLSSQEAPEDDAKLGRLMLKEACEGKKRVVFIGVSCGLSAPFVAGQLDFCLRHPEVFTPVLVGFNPAHQARDEPIEGCTFTFRSVVQRMLELAQSQRAFIISPAVGPEAISGSSRMKGGSATKILLEVILSTAQAAAFSRAPLTETVTLQYLLAYKNAVDVTYSRTEQISTLVEAAGKSLRCGGRVCYLGWGTLAVLGLIDASECNPTFGADYEDIRGFIAGGYVELDNSEGPLTSLGPDFSISHEEFFRSVLPSLTDRDTVLLLYTHSDDLGEVAALARRVRERTSNLHAIYHRGGGDNAATDRQQWELSTKLLLNAISTGGHVLKGKVYRNHMVDVQVTNSKLYRRAARLLQKLSGHPKSRCEEALLKAIYQSEQLTSAIPLSDVRAHTAAANHRSRVVPLALILLLTNCSLKEAESRLEQQPIIREVVVVCLS